MLTQYAPSGLHNAVLDWFKSHKLEVHMTHYQFDHGFYAWRHHAEKGALTLWVSELTTEDYEPSTIIAILKDFEPHALIAKFRQAHIHVASNNSEFGAYARDVFSPSAA